MKEVGYGGLTVRDVARADGIHGNKCQKSTKKNKIYLHLNLNYTRLSPAVIKPCTNTAFMVNETMCRQLEMKEVE